MLSALRLASRIRPGRAMTLAFACVVAAGCAASGALRRGETAERRQDYDLAVVEFTKAVRLNPNDAGIRVALAMAVEDGVVAAVIHDADKLAIGKIAKRRYELAERARANKLRPEDISRGTFTISNLGMFNVDAFQAIITPPQAAILAVGRIVDRVVAVDGQAAIRPMMNLTLSCDHRVMDGAMAAGFLDDLARGLEGAEGTSSGLRPH